MIDRDSEQGRKFKEELDQLLEQMGREFKENDEKFAGQPWGGGMDLCDQHAVEDERAYIRFLNACIDLRVKYGIKEKGAEKKRELPPDFPG